MVGKIIAIPIKEIISAYLKSLQRVAALQNEDCQGVK